jgi:hypothetical protein
MGIFSTKPKDQGAPVPPVSNDRLFKIMEQEPINGNISSSTQTFQQMTDRLGKTQQAVSSEIDTRIESLQHEYKQLDEVDKQLRSLAKVIENHWAVVILEKKKLARILDYHMKNKEKRIALGNELIVQEQKEKLEGEKSGS